jgi:hypothetical protein
MPDHKEPQYSHPPCNLRTGSAELEAAGWTGPGWYFYDETDAGLVGPYDSDAAARDARRRYAADLDAREEPR